MTLNEIRQKLQAANITMAYRQVSSNVIAHLDSYEISLDTKELDLASLFGAYQGLCWLCGYLESLKEVDKNYHLMVATALEAVARLYQKHRRI